MQFFNVYFFIHVFVPGCLLSLVAGMSPDSIQQLLISHNFYRRLFALSDEDKFVSNMNKLAWDPYLALQAAREVSCDSWNVSLPNTNVGRIRSHPLMVTYIVRRWFSQQIHFWDEDQECFPWDSCPNLRNMVNAKRRGVGCAIVQNCGHSQNKAVVMCKYRGGISDEFGFEYGPPCTGCDGRMSFCKNELCDACDPRESNCECRKTCHKEGIGFGHLSASTCSCECDYGRGPNCDKPCENRQQFVDFDICSMLSHSDCDDPIDGDLYKEFCPALCSCRPFQLIEEDNLQ